MRNLHPDFKKLCNEDDIAPVRLVELDMLPNPFYLWDGIGNLRYAGKVYQGLGHLSSIEPIKETTSIQSEQVSLELTCLNHVESFSDIRNHTYQNRTATIHYGFLSQSKNEIIGVEESAFIGRMDSLTVPTSSEGSRIKIIVTNEMSILKKSWNKFQTDSDHQSQYPGDTSRRFIPAIQDLEIRL